MQQPNQSEFKEFFSTCLFICDNILIHVFLLNIMSEYFGQNGIRWKTIARMYWLNEYNAGVSPLYRQEGLL